MHGVRGSLRLKEKKSSDASPIALWGGEFASPALTE
jgi:hypothetical protein